MSEVHLSSQHRQMLELDSGILPEVIAARGYRTVTAAEARKFGFTGQQARDGLLLPVHTTDGQVGLYVLRPDNPRVVEDKRHKKDPLTGDRPQKVIKYEWPKGVGPRVDCPPTCYPQLKDPQIPLWITEGQKKGDALASWGLCAIDLPNGVWGWKSKQDGILADLDTIVWAEREVFVVFDSDVITKETVAQALARLTKILSRRGAKVTPVPLPQQGDGKLGVDDFRARGGLWNSYNPLLPWAGCCRSRPMVAAQNQAPPNLWVLSTNWDTAFACGRSMTGSRSMSSPCPTRCGPKSAPACATWATGTWAASRMPIPPLPIAMLTTPSKITCGVLTGTGGGISPPWPVSSGTIMPPSTRP